MSKSKYRLEEEFDHNEYIFDCRLRERCFGEFEGHKYKLSGFEFNHPAHFLSAHLMSCALLPSSGHINSLHGIFID